MSVPYSITKHASALSGLTHYYATPQLRGTKTTKEIAKTIAAKTTVTLPDVKAVLTAVGEVVVDALHDGYQCELEGIGKLRLALKSTNAESYESFTATNIVGARVRMLPQDEMKSIYQDMDFEFVPTRKDQEIAKAAAKAGKTVVATDKSTTTTPAGDVD